MPIHIGTAEITLTVNLLTTTGDSVIEASEVHESIAIGEPAYFSLQGRVVDSIGGAGVGDAPVVLEGSVYTAQTDPDGFFSFTNILTGVYDIIVSGNNRAGARLAQVHVNNSDADVVIVQPKYGWLQTATTPPVILVKGIEHGKEYNGLIPINVIVRPGSCPVQATEFHKSIYLKIGTTAMSYFEVANSDTEILSYVWNTSLLPAGTAIVKVVAYDTNNNRSELDTPVTISPGPGQVPGLAPVEDFYYIVANTYGRSMEITRAYPVFPVTELKSFPSNRAIPDSTMIVEFNVAKYYNGVTVYKSPALDGAYSLLGQTSFTESGEYKCIDYSPDLVPGTVYYKLAYFNRYGSGPQTGPIPVRILPTYSLDLVSPANNSNVTDTTPTITWTCVPFLDAQRTDWIIASNVLDATIVAYSFVMDQMEFVLPDLAYNNTYEWDIRSFYQYVNSQKTANVLSRSFPRGRGAYDFSSNGAFYFTVVEP
jgi:hypothetical protein